MRKIITSKFELELSSFKISDQESNGIFSDTYFVKTTMPFDIDMDDDLDIAMGFISEYTTNPQMFYECLYCHNNKIEKGTLEIQQVIGRKISCVLQFGLENLPSWDTKLADLPLDVFDLPSGVDIYQYFEQIILLSWPDVKFNFPQVHTDKFDTTSDTWFHFEKIINNRKDGYPLKNEYNTSEEEHYNRNIIQPLPYFLYIIQKGIAAAGFTLAGEILEDERLQKATLFSVKEYAENNKSNIEDNITFGLADYDTITSHGTTANPRFHLKYDRSFTITKPGFYRVVGTFDTATNYAYYENSIEGKLDTTYIFQKINPELKYDHSILTWDINTPITISDSSTHTVHIHAEQYVDSLDGRPLCDLNLVLVSAMDDDGNLLPSVNIENKIDLKKSVPDMTFGELMNDLKNYMNYSITKIDGTTVYINKAVSLLESNDDLIDLTTNEIKFPTRKSSTGNSYYLKFQDIDSKDYSYLPVFQNKTTIRNDKNLLNEKTITIETKILPLPIATREGVSTAHSFENTDTKAYLVIYDGIYNGNNYSKPIADYLLPAVHLEYWNSWFLFMIKSIIFNWIFNDYYQNILDLTINSKVYAYNNWHIIKTLNRTEISPDIFTIDIETQCV